MMEGSVTIPLHAYHEFVNHKERADAAEKALKDLKTEIKGTYVILSQPEYHLPSLAERALYIPVIVNQKKLLELLGIAESVPATIDHKKLIPQLSLSDE